MIPVYRVLDVTPHPNADLLDIVRIQGYQSIVQKDKFKVGDLVTYIPEQHIVPESILLEIGLKGKLAGPGKDRVRAIKIRGVLSQGLCLEAPKDATEGDLLDLGVRKWDAPIPVQLSGKVKYIGQHNCIKYNIENLKAWPKAFEDGRPVVITEKTHGTWMCMGLINGQRIVTSKGQSAKGLVFDDSERNLYTEVADRLWNRFGHLRSALREFTEALGFDPDTKTLGEPGEPPVYLLGEVYGAVQDLTYNHKPGQTSFLAFDVFVGQPNVGTYLSDLELDEMLSLSKIPRVPILYRGPFSIQNVENLTSGPETISGQGLHTREGVVIRSQVESYYKGLGRLQLKSISEDYLLRRKGTEYQ